jgi:hypothetical protein
MSGWVGEEEVGRKCEGKREGSGFGDGREESKRTERQGGRNERDLEKEFTAITDKVCANEKKVAVCCTQEQRSCKTTDARAVSVMLCSTKLSLRIR